ncbi:ABC transporter permease subunit [Clostridium sp. MCC353]|uniref:ABC transporter permease n=1 Tax=Clostridium sp. MCC353 TaxID=2592646 RepID=UPI001C029845|nr:ABC transporter permease [Clostridium sp. MCC353]MBT9775487.1 ABC transporter permease subunit [Clostridium sp. MCC353]
MKRNKSKKESSFSGVMKRLCRNKLAMIGLGVIVIMVLAAVFADFIAPYSYTQQDLMNTFCKPGGNHLFGTDKVGRDILSRLIYGARESLKIGFLSVLMAAFFGIIMGAVAGYYGGMIDNLLMRLLDIYQSIPSILLTMVLASALGASGRNTIIALGITTIPIYARILRSQFMVCRDQEYVEAAVATNANDFEIIFKHILPNAISPLIVQITMSLGQSILAAATLSFLGLGVQPPSPEWGAMVSDGRNYLRNYPYLALFPGLCIMLTVLSFNLLGDGLRDALDPKLKN